jgi:hypothetical protein
MSESIPLRAAALVVLAIVCPLLGGCSPARYYVETANWALVQGDAVKDDATLDAVRVSDRRKVRVLARGLDRKRAPLPVPASPRLVEVEARYRPHAVLVGVGAALQIAGVSLLGGGGGWLAQCGYDGPCTIPSLSLMSVGAASVVGGIVMQLVGFIPKPPEVPVRRSD